MKWQEQNMASVLRKQIIQGHQFTEAQYLAYERKSEAKHEYFQGTIYAMASASYRHSLINTNLIRHLHSGPDDNGYRAALAGFFAHAQRHLSESDVYTVTANTESKAHP